MPSSVKDRLTCSYEHIYHFVKARKYFYDLDAIRKPHKLSSLKRISEDLEAQHGGPKEKAYLEQNIIPAGGDTKQISKILKRVKKNIQEGKGKNPGDTVTSPDAKFLDESLPSHIKGIARSRDKYRSLGLPEGNILGKNPGDLVEAFQGRPPTNWYRMGEDSKGKNPGDFLSIPTQPFPEAHFAVYPEKICEDPIKASCPAQICVKCGKPRKRITQTKNPSKHLADYENIRNFANVQQRTSNPQSSKSLHRNISPNGKAKGVYYSGVTVGFSDCGCAKGFQPGVVLDPMCGSGTTLVVAHKLGRNWIGIDLNPAYVEMANKRLESVGAFSSRLEKFVDGEG